MKNKKCIKRITAVGCSVCVALSFVGASAFVQPDESTALVQIVMNENENEDDGFARISGRKIYTALVCESAKVYSTYKTSGDVIANVKEGDSILVLEYPVMVKNDRAVWLRTLVNGRVGYVPESALTRNNQGKRIFAPLESSNSMAIPKKNIPVFAEKSTSSDRVGSVSKGVAFVVLDETRWYYKTMVGDQVGYIVKADCLGADYQSYSLNE